MRVLFIGDLHGDVDAAQSYVQVAKATKADRAIQVGDLGYWPGTVRHDEFFETLDLAGIPMHFCDGNHENHEALGSTKPDATPTEVSEWVTWVPRGWQLHGKRSFGFFGGAHSVDKDWLVPGKSWFPEETPTAAQFEAARDTLAGIDVFVTHDVGPFVDFGYPPPHKAIWPEKDIHASNAIQREMGELAKAIRPKLWVHGHHHQRKTTLWGHGIIESLACDGAPGTFYVLDL